MPVNRREFIALSVAEAAMLQGTMKALTTATRKIQVSIDATQISAPIHPMIFGGYMEPATTQVWAEILTDRKFANAITSAPTPVTNESILSALLWRAVQVGWAGRNG